MADLLFGKVECWHILLIRDLELLIFSLRLTVNLIIFPICNRVFEFKLRIKTRKRAVDGPYLEEASRPQERAVFDVDRVVLQGIRR